MNALRILLVAAGFLSVGLGTAGIFLPILPTAPLYVLAVICFARGSKRFHDWFVNTKLYKKHIGDLAATRCMAMRAKLIILIPVSIMLVLAAALVDVLAMRIVIAVLIIVKWWYFLFVIKTAKP